MSDDEKPDLTCRDRIVLGVMAVFLALFWFAAFKAWPLAVLWFFGK